MTTAKENSLRCIESAEAVLGRCYNLIDKAPVMTRSDFSNVDLVAYEFAVARLLQESISRVLTGVCESLEGVGKLLDEVERQFTGGESDG